MTGNDGEKIEHHGQSLRQFVLRTTKLLSGNDFPRPTHYRKKQMRYSACIYIWVKQFAKNSKVRYFMYTKTKKRSYHTNMPSLISTLTVIMFVLVHLMETQKHWKKMYRQICQRTIVKLREATVGMKPKAASEHLRKTISSAANALEIPKNYNQGAYARRSLKLFCLFQAALMHWQMQYINARN